jgi:vitamin B12 transporter
MELSGERRDVQISVWQEPRLFFQITFSGCLLDSKTMNKKVLLVCLGLIAGLVLQAQQADTLLKFDDVIVTSSRFEQFNTGSKTQHPDSVASITYRTQSLAELLGMQSQVYIRSYGSGGLASNSFRGGATEHTAVLWKGFNLQSPMHGQVDFSLINNDVADNINIQYGGNGALFGSGAVGGTISLISSAKYNSGLHATTGVQLGSYGHFRQQASFSYGNKKWYSSTKWYRLAAQNNFEYTNTYQPDKPLLKQTNAQIAQQGIVTEHYFKLRPNQELNVNFWYQYANTQIPPSMSVPNSDAYQQDENYRATAEWKLSKQYVTWVARTAYLDQSIYYADPVDTALTGTNHSMSSISEVESRISFNSRHRINIGINNTYVNAYSKGYYGWFNQNRLAAFASYKMIDVIKNVTTTLSIREEMVEDKSTPVMPSFGFEWRPVQRLKVFGNISRSYRIPTFNEKYWFTGIKRDLKPETGWGEELSIAYRQPVKRVMLNLTVTAFNRNMQDWIMWLPKGGTIWSPENLKKVWSRGLETEFGALVPFTKWQLKYRGMVNYVLSTNTQTGYVNDGALDKQLIYVPRVSQQHQLTAAFKSYYIGYLHSYTGLRFISTDNTQWLDDYMIATVVAGKELKWKKYSLVLTAQVNNVFNTTYQAVADRPMPGRNFLITITIKL